MPILNSFPEDVIELAKHIKLLALDVDGVLTDGSIFLDSNGLREGFLFRYDIMNKRFYNNNS